jgi:hypothetical protein
MRRAKMKGFRLMDSLPMVCPPTKHFVKPIMKKPKKPRPAAANDEWPEGKDLRCSFTAEGLAVQMGKPPKSLEP